MVEKKNLTELQLRRQTRVMHLKKKNSNEKITSGNRVQTYTRILDKTYAIGNNMHETITGTKSHI